MLTCLKHRDRLAAARCIACGKLMCDDCRRRVDHRNYCESCPPASVKKLAKLKKPLLAGALSVIPGLGHLYVGSPLRAVIAFGSMAFLLANIDQMNLPPFLPPALWFLSFVDAITLARKHNQTAPLATELAAATQATSSAPAPQPAAAAQPIAAAAPRRSRAGRVFVGLTAATVGALLLLKATMFPHLSVELMWPVSAILGGLSFAIGGR